MLSTAPLAATTRVVDGIAVMERPTDAFARAPRLVDSAPVATVVGSPRDPACDLTDARQVVVLDDERVVVRPGPENGEVALRVFSFRPEPVTTIGGD